MKNSNRYYKSSTSKVEFIIFCALLLAAVLFPSIPTLSQNSVWAWGGNCSGQLGCANEADCPGSSWGDWGGPIELSAISNISTISAGFGHSLVNGQDGMVWAWGNNCSGQLGTDNTTSTDYPVQVLNLKEVIAVACGNYGSVGLKTDGTVWQWGFFGTDPCPDCGCPDGFKIPTKVAGLSNVIAVSAGNFHAVALKNDGTVWAWGANYGGQLGDGTTIDREIPVQVVGLENIIAITFCRALRNDGTVWRWGGCCFPAQQMADLYDITAISSGTHSLAIKNDGTLWAWGNTRTGQWGDGTTPRPDVRVHFLNLPPVFAASAGDSFSVAATGDGKVWAWGANFWGQLGDGTTNESHVPIQVSNVNDVTKLSAGWVHTLALQTTPPVINSIKKIKDPFRVKICGASFHNNLKIYIADSLVPWENVRVLNENCIILKKGVNLKSQFPKNQCMAIKIVNDDGGYALTEFCR